jgi:hypothetical protein
MDQTVAHLIEIFLPTSTNEGQRFDREPFDQVRDELLQQFGGVTLFTRNPAEGLWTAEDGNAPSVDQMITVEVMTDELDQVWWLDYRQKLERRFQQEVILIRSYQVRRL